MMEERRKEDTDKTILDGIAGAKERLGKDLLLLAHFYQHDDIVRYADFVGDSLQLAEKAAGNRDARYIVFCSVSFMAETARILCRPDQEVLHPEPFARCPLANMASIDQVEKAWEVLSGLGKKIIPVVYVNSNADLKAFCARHGGTVCTSANVKRIFSHVLAQDASLFFFPDENMGRNVCARSRPLRGRDVPLGPREGPCDDEPKGAGFGKSLSLGGFLHRPPGDGGRRTWRGSGPSMRASR